MTTINEAIRDAGKTWRTSHKEMVHRCRVVAEALRSIQTVDGVETSAWATDTLKGINPSGLRLAYGKMLDDGLSLQSVRTYVAAFKVAMKQAGVDTSNWPATPTLPRTKPREAIDVVDIRKCRTWLENTGYHFTSSLAAVLLHTGMRVDVEALDMKAWRFLRSKGEAMGLEVTGKGGHQRVTLVFNKEAIATMQDETYYGQMVEIGYDSHSRRWRDATVACGVQSKLPTLHSIRHRYATDMMAHCQNLEMVRQMMGHACITTTARYIGVDLEQMARALCPQLSEASHD